MYQVYVVFKNQVLSLLGVIFACWLS